MTEKPIQKTLDIHHVDLPNLSETFADAIELVHFDEQTPRMNFPVTRYDQRQNAPVANARRFPACRLVLTPNAAFEPMNQIQRLMARMVQAGVLKANPLAKPNEQVN